MFVAVCFLAGHKNCSNPARLPRHHKTLLKTAPTQQTYMFIPNSDKEKAQNKMQRHRRRHLASSCTRVYDRRTAAAPRWQWEKPTIHRWAVLQTIQQSPRDRARVQGRSGNKTGREHRANLPPLPRSRYDTDKTSVNATVIQQYRVDGGNIIRVRPTADSKKTIPPPHTTRTPRTNPDRKRAGPRAGDLDLGLELSRRLASRSPRRPSSRLRLGLRGPPPRRLPRSVPHLLLLHLQNRRSLCCRYRMERLFYTNDKAPTAMAIVTATTEHRVAEAPEASVGAGVEGEAAGEAVGASLVAPPVAVGANVKTSLSISDSVGDAVGAAVSSSCSPRPSRTGLSPSTLAASLLPTASRSAEGLSFVTAEAAAELPTASPARATTRTNERIDTIVLVFCPWCYEWGWAVGGFSKAPGREKRGLELLRGC